MMWAEVAKPRGVPGGGDSRGGGRGGGGGGDKIGRQASYLVMVHMP